MHTHTGELSESIERDNNSLTFNNSDQTLVEPIDGSTTFFMFMLVAEECLFYKFGKKVSPDFKPQSGYGYRKVTKGECEDIKTCKRVIVMKKVTIIILLTTDANIKVLSDNIIIMSLIIMTVTLIYALISRHCTIKLSFTN